MYSLSYHPAIHMVNWVKCGQISRLSAQNRHQSRESAVAVQAMPLPMWLLPSTSCKLDPFCLPGTSCCFCCHDPGWLVKGFHELVIDFRTNPRLPFVPNQNESP